MEKDNEESKKTFFTGSHWFLLSILLWVFLIWLEVFQLGNPKSNGWIIFLAAIVITICAFIVWMEQKK